MDQIALYAMYMPILRKEIQSFVRTWNLHYIRKQPHRPTVVHGKPFMNYYYPADGVRDLGIPIDTDTCENLQSIVQDWGNYIVFFPYFLIVYILTLVIDMNEYLPEATFNWCRTRLLEMEFDPSQPPPIPGAERSTPYRTIYLQFREIVGRHIASNADPVLGLYEAPET